MAHPDRNLTSRIDLLSQSSYKKLIECSKSDEDSNSATLVSIFGAGNKLIKCAMSAEEAAKDAMQRIKRAAAGEILSPKELP